MGNLNTAHTSPEARQPSAGVTQSYREGQKVSEATRNVLEITRDAWMPKELEIITIH